MLDVADFTDIFQHFFGEVFAHIEAEAEEQNQEATDPWQVSFLNFKVKSKFSKIFYHVYDQFNLIINYTKLLS